MQVVAWIMKGQVASTMPGAAKAIFTSSLIAGTYANLNLGFADLNFGCNCRSPPNFPSAGQLTLANYSAPTLQPVVPPTQTQSELAVQLTLVPISPASTMAATGAFNKEQAAKLGVQNRRQARGRCPCSQPLWRELRMLVCSSNLRLED
jgi:hypothetical protein